MQKRPQSAPPKSIENDFQQKRDGFNHDDIITRLRLEIGKLKQFIKNRDSKIFDLEQKLLVQRTRPEKDPKEIENNQIRLIVARLGKVDYFKLETSN